MPCPEPPPCPAPPPCWLYLIRHGATDNNQASPPRLQGRTDTCLSVDGLRQAERTAQWLASRPVAAVYSSPLLRARQTAESIARGRHLKVQPVGDLIEVDIGRWEGLSWEEVERTDPEAYRRFMADASTNPYLGGEDLSTVQARVIPAVERLMAQNAGRLIVAVAHNVVNRAYLAHLLRMPLAHYRSIPQDNCGVNLLRSQNGRIKVVTLNSVDHLQKNGLT